MANSSSSIENHHANQNNNLTLSSVWNRPFDGTGAVATEMEPVLGTTTSWPALSNLISVSPDASSSDSLKSFSGGSSSSAILVHGIETASASTSKETCGVTNNNQRNRSALRFHGGSGGGNGPTPNLWRSQYESHGMPNQAHRSQYHNPGCNFNGRGGHLQPLPVGPVFTRHPTPPYSGLFFHDLAMQQHFGRPLGYQELPPAMYHPPPRLPYVAPPIRAATTSYPVPDLGLFDKILTQIHYYFSKENLCKDLFLRQKMDNQGWIPIYVIASFRMVQSLTKDPHLILQALRSSHIVEVKGTKIRLRDDWKKWLVPPSLQIPGVTSYEHVDSSKSNQRATGVQNLSLDRNGADQSGFNGHRGSQTGNSQTKISTSKSSSTDVNTMQLDDKADRESGSAIETKESTSRSSWKVKGKAIATMSG